MATLFGIRSSARPDGAGYALRCAGMVTRRCITISRGETLETPRATPVARSGRYRTSVPASEQRRPVTTKCVEDGGAPPIRRVIVNGDEASIRPATQSASTRARGQHKKQPKSNEAYHPTLFTMTTPHPSQLTKDVFLEWLDASASTAPYPDRYSAKTKTIVILTTPTFSTWIQDADFVGRMVSILVKKCYRVIRVQTTAAVVDGLFPPGQLNASRPIAQSAEGFSFMVTQDDADAAEPISLKTLSDLSAEPSPSSGLRFNFIKMKNGVVVKRPSLVEMIVPLANTLFRNGRKSTLMVSDWVKTGKVNRHSVFRATSVEYKETSDVRTEGFRVPSDFSLPLDELTKPRKIVAGLGNIVRQLEGDRGELLPASTELEESVVSYLTAKKLPQQQVSVWALVVPEDEMLRHRARFPENLVPWHLLRDSKAGLHRVLSGGGGWGTKAGLLSLDPDVRAPGFTGSQPGDDFAAFQNRFAEVDEQTHALGDIAKPGSYVWFLIAHEGLVDENGKLVDLNREKDLSVTNLLDKDSWRKIRLGCIRSTIDDVPTDSLPAFQQKTSPMHLSYDFGAQSELGIYASFRQLVDDTTYGKLQLAKVSNITGEKSDNSAHLWEVVNASRIDVPGATFDAYFWPPAKNANPKPAEKPNGPKPGPRKEDPTTSLQGQATNKIKQEKRLTMKAKMALISLFRDETYAREFLNVQDDEAMRVYWIEEQMKEHMAKQGIESRLDDFFVSTPQNETHCR